MEISPISGIRAMPAVKAPPVNSELTPLSDIENNARAGDETWSPSDQRSSRGSEDDGSEDEFDDLDGTDSEAGAESQMLSVEIDPRRAISFFA
jgi:hypothetical protein